MHVQTSFAVQANDIGEVVAKLSELLGLSFVPHESSYRGEYYRHEGEAGSMVIVALNKDPMYRVGDPEEQQFMESAFRELAVLVHVTVPAEWESRFKQAVLAVGSKVVEVRRNAAA